MSDAAYDATAWDGVATEAPSKNAMRDKLETLAALAGASFTGKVNFGAGIQITDDDGATAVNGLRALVFVTPPTADNDVGGVVFKLPDSDHGVEGVVDYAEGNAWVTLGDADGGLQAAPARILKTVASTTNATPVVVTTTAVHGFNTGDVVLVRGTGIAALDRKWWKITVLSTTTFSLNSSTAPGSTAAIGSVFSDQSAVLTRNSFDGAIGMQGLHVAGGLRGRSGYTVGPTSVAAWVDLSADMVGLAIHNAPATEMAEAQTADYIQIIDTRAANAKRFGVNAAGQTVHDVGTAALPGMSFVGDENTGLYNTPDAIGFATAGALRAAFSTTTFSLVDGINMDVGTGTGTKFGIGAGRKMGWFNATPVGKQTLTGSRAANAAVASIATCLANLGFATDSTTV